MADQPNQDLGRILVVEDERIIARDLANTLGDLGYSVAATAATGEDAIRLANELRPSLILMDVQLAGSIDGVQAAKEICSQWDVPIIYLTAYSDDETLRRAKQTEPCGYLVKPFKAPELRCAIEIALHKHEINGRLKERERWLATTLRSIGDGVITTDNEQRINFLNPIAEALTGWKHEEAFGKTIAEIMNLVAETDNSQIENPIGLALRNQSIATLQDDTVLVDRTQGNIPIADSAAPIVDDKGNVLGGVMIFRDVTEQRRAQEEIRRLNDELEHFVLKRTQQLEAANQELEAFNYSVAHDLRAPLRRIQGFSQALIEDHATHLGAEGLTHLHRVREAGQRMGELIEDLLRLGRVAKTDILAEEVNLSQIAQHVAQELQISRSKRNVEFVVQENLVVQGDRSLLQVVLENLFSNAYKFTAKNPHAKIEFGACQNGNRSAYFVRDNGVGFDMAYANKLFGAFQRLHTTHEFEGSGIGLAIVQRIIQRHQGVVWAESVVGSGATFNFTLNTA